MPRDALARAGRRANGHAARRHLRNYFIKTRGANGLRKLETRA